MTDAHSNDTSLRLSIALIIIIAGFLAYANTFNGGWVWDDASSILLHKHVQDPSKIFQLFKEDQHAFGLGEGNFYRPLLSVTFMIDFLLAYDPALDAAPDAIHPAVKPFVFHVSSLLWHSAAALLLLAVLIRAGAPQFVYSAVPILYVLHPLHTEAVAYISGRADMMSAAFMYAALFLALSPALPPRRYIAWAFSLLCLVAGLCSKESTMIYPLILALFVFIGAGPDSAQASIKLSRRQRAIPLGLSALVLGVYIALRSTVLQFADASSPVTSTFSQRLTESAQAFTLYVQSLFFPTHMHMERTLDGVPVWYALIGSLLMASFVMGAVIAYRTGQRRICIGLAWFLLAWLPISGLFPLNAPLAEHWMYVPMAGFWWAFFEVIYLVSRHVAGARYLPHALAYGFAVVFIALTVARNQDWDSDKSLFEATLRENPDTRRVNFNLAVTFEDIQENPAGARRHYQDVLRLIQDEKSKSGQEQRYFTPEELEVHFSLGNVNEALGDFSQAARHYAYVTLASENPQLAQMATLAQFRLGRCLIATGDIANASAYLQQAASREPALAYDVEQLLMGAPITGG